MAWHIIEFPYELTDLDITGYLDEVVVPDIRTIPDDSGSPERTVHEADARRIVGVLLRELEPREERLLRMNYGLGVDEMTQTEILAAIDIPRGQMLGALRRAHRRMRFAARGRLLRTLL